MNVTLEELLQLLGAKDVEIYLLKQQIAVLASKEQAEKRETPSG